MYWALYTVQERARTKLCYRYRPMAKEGLDKGYQQRMAKGTLIRRCKAEMKEEKPVTATRAKGNDITDKR